MGSTQSGKFRGMKTTKAQLTCLLLCLAVNLINASDATKDDVEVEKKGDADNFFAARGRRSGEGDSSNGAASPDDFFWANRGKRSIRVLRDNGNFNVPRPNGFFFPSATGKRGLSRFFPKSNTFFHLPKHIIDAIRAQNLMHNQKFRRSSNWSKGADANSWPQWPYIKPRLI